MDTSTKFVIFCATSLLLFACSGRDAPPPSCIPDIDCPADAAVDTGADAASDASADAGFDGAADSALADATTDAPVDAAPVDAGPLTGDTYVFVTDVLDMAAADPAGDPNVVSGFDLDGRVSDASDRLGCRKADRMAPPPDSFEGVDNELGPLLVSGESSFGFIANLRAVVRSGELLMLLRVRGVDDLVNDDRVEVDVLFGQMPSGATAPVRTAADRFEAGQTFDVQAESFDATGEAKVRLNGQIVDGRLRGAGGDLRLGVPFMGRVVMLSLSGVHLRFNLTASAFDTGILGAGVDVETTITALVGGGVDPSVARLVLEGAADLLPDDRMRCQSVSVGLIMAGVPAVLGDTVAVAP